MDGSIRIEFAMTTSDASLLRESFGLIFNGQDIEVAKRLHSNHAEYAGRVGCNQQ